MCWICLKPWLEANRWLLDGLTPEDDLIDLPLVLQGLLQVGSEQLALLKELRDDELVVLVQAEHDIVLSLLAELEQPLDVPLQDADV